ncbi:MAG: hypothetical protein RL299_1743 [Pseudomonadota bacterium]
MRAPLFIAIGVHKPVNMDPLPGVIESVDGMTAWAQQQGYDTVQFDDRAGPVLADRIKDQLTPLKSDGFSRDGALLLDRPRIMVYFCGHGLHAPGDQYWVLTPGPDQPAHRISAVTFQDALATYAPKQVGVISDACNVPKAVIGTAVAPVDPYTGQARPVQRDTFRSSQEGKPSFAVPAKDGAPPYCIFTSVLLTALSMPQVDALSPVYLKLGEDKVSSDSLATYLEAKVPDAALDVGRLQDPVCNPGFRAFDDVYVEFPSAPPQSIGPDPGPPPEKGLPQMASVELDDPAQKHRFNRSQSEWRRPYIEDLAKRVQAFKDNRCPENPIGHLFVSQDTGGTPLPEPRMIDSQGICSAEESPYFAYPTWIVKNRKGFFDTGRSSTLIVQSGPFSCAVAMHHNLWSTVLFGNRSDIPGGHGGVELLAWGHGGRPDSMPDRQEAALSAAEALKGLSNGTLQARDIPALARDMRYTKHADPMFGIVPAYLYASIGDLENIYRMCTYYLWHDQDVPFDIALLSGLPLLETNSGGFCIEVPKVDEVPEELRAPDMPDFIWRNTPATRVAVAGITPTLRLGWQKLGNAEHAVHQRLFELSEYLTESPVATLYGPEAGQKLIAIFREQQS